MAMAANGLRHHRVRGARRTMARARLSSFFREEGRSPPFRPRPTAALFDPRPRQNVTRAPAQGTIPTLAARTHPRARSETYAAQKSPAAVLIDAVRRRRYDSN